MQWVRVSFLEDGEISSIRQQILSDLASLGLLTDVLDYFVRVVPPSLARQNHSVLIMNILLIDIDPIHDKNRY